jgi:hypothetical protein
MIRLTKSKQPAPINSDDDYRKNPVLQTLADDCYGKCYICEDKPTTINVEHIVPHRSDPTLKYEWDNLFIACGHCNNTKHTKFDDILNPAKCDPEEHIALSVEIFNNLVDKVRIESLTTNDSTLLTVELLELVYNDGSTPIKKLECSNLRNEHLVPNIRTFLQYINNYREEPEIGYDVIINKEISRSSAFAAFKRKIVRDDPELSAKFAGSLKT